MPQVKFAPAALRDLERLREFLRPKNAEAAKRAAAAIVKAVQVLGSQPHIGRTVEELPEAFREWLIEYGDSGYVARYRHDGGEHVTVLSIRHQKEAGY
jgi:plasmid stabilization system protein ParE